MNSNGGRQNKINYWTLLTQLKKELPERSLKKPKVEKNFYPSEAQKRLLHICGCIDFLNPPGFSSVSEVNDFVTNFVNKRTAFENEYKTLPCPGMFQFQFSFFQRFIHVSLNYSVVVHTILLVQVT